jgi:hypothetical protein
LAAKPYDWISAFSQPLAAGVFAAGVFGDLNSLKPKTRRKRRAK